MSEKEEVKKKKRFDRTQIAIRVMAVILVLAMVLPIIISGIYALKG